MHVSVLRREVIEYLQIDPCGIYVDATAGCGGHATEILKKLGPHGVLVMADCDDKALEKLQPQFSVEKRCHLFRARFSELFGILQQNGWVPIHGLLADLGFSTDQLEDPLRGMSFQLEAPLDMRLDSRLDETAADLLARRTETELGDLIFQYGEERYARKLARALVKKRRLRPLKTTTDLARAAEEVLGSYYRRQKIHPATRLFQALRIAVNHEIEELQQLLDKIPNMLRRGGRAAVISFHSLEDRTVKRSFKDLGRQGWKIITKKPVNPSDEERTTNPRSRSAKLRVIEKSSDLS